MGTFSQELGDEYFSSRLLAYSVHLPLQLSASLHLGATLFQARWRLFIQCYLMIAVMGSIAINRTVQHRKVMLSAVLLQSASFVKVPLRAQAPQMHIAVRKLVDVPLSKVTRTGRMRKKVCATGMLHGMASIYIVESQKLTCVFHNWHEQQIVVPSNRGLH
jgi:hypothetical protein